MQVVEANGKRLQPYGSNKCKLSGFRRRYQFFRSLWLALGADLPDVKLEVHKDLQKPKQVKEKSQSYNFWSDLP